MNYLDTSVWIFFVVIICVSACFIFGSSAHFIFGLMMLLPVLIGYQAYVVLKAEDVPEKTFDEHWYDQK